MPRSSLLNIPYEGTRTVEPVSPPTVWQNIRVDEDMFGAGKGKALQHLGEAIGKVGGQLGEVFEKQQLEADTTRARELDIDMMKKDIDLRVKYGAMDEKTAVDYKPEYDAESQKIRDDAVKAAGDNKRVTRLITKQADERLVNRYEFGAKHHAKEAEKYTDKLSVDRINTAIDDATTSQDLNTLNRTLGVVEAETLAWGERRGKDSETIKNQIKDFTSKAYLNYISFMAIRDWKGAKQMYEDVKDKLNGATRKTLETAVKEAENSQGSRELADQYVRGGATPEKPDPLPGYGPKGEPPKGQTTPGNIDLLRRPVYTHPNGKISTEASITVKTDKGVVVIPTVSEDGTRLLSNDDAIKQYNETGKHLGIFKSEDEANAYAQELSKVQAKRYGPRKSDIQGFGYPQLAGAIPSPDSSPEIPQSAASFLAKQGYNVANVPIGMTVNNPGNIKYTGSDWQQRNLQGISKSHTTDQGDPQAAFSSPQAGMNAAAILALTKYGQGMDTVAKIIGNEKGWTPGNTHAVNSISSLMGVGANDKLDLRDPATMTRFLRALVAQEHGQASKAYPQEMYSKATVNALGRGGDTEPHVTEEEPAQQRAAPGSGRAQVLRTTEVPKNLSPATTKFAETVLSEFPGVRITSGYRDHAHNERVGGAKGSQHISGKAIDISMKGMSDEEQAAVIDRALEMGAKGIGYYGNGKAHIDFRANPAAWGPDTTSASLGKTPAWFQQRAAKLTNGDIRVAAEHPTQTGGGGGSGGGGRVRYASLGTGTVSDVSPVIGTSAVREQVAQVAQPQPAIIDALSAQTPIAEVTRRMEEAREIGRLRGNEEMGIRAANQIMVDFEKLRHADTIAKAEARNEVMEKAAGNPAKDIKKATHISEITDDPKLRATFGAMDPEDRRRVEAIVLDNARIANRSDRKRTPTAEDWEVFHAFSGSKKLDKEGWMTADIYSEKYNFPQSMIEKIQAERLEEIKTGNLAKESARDKAIREVGVATLKGTSIDPKGKQGRLFLGILDEEVTMWEKANKKAADKERVEIISKVLVREQVIKEGIIFDTKVRNFQLPNQYKDEMIKEMEKRGVKNPEPLEIWKWFRLKYPEKIK